MNPDPDMRPEYDFSGGVRGKHYRQVVEGSNIVVVDPDLADDFPTSDAVNAGLRELQKLRKRFARASTPR